MSVGFKPKKDSEGRPIFAPSFADYEGLTTVWAGKLYTATAGALNIFDAVVTTELILRGGWYEMMDNNAVLGDYIEFSVVDKDDVLGLFSTYGLTVGQDILELKKFVRKDYINPVSTHRREEFLSDGASRVVPGLYLRTTYYSTGQNDVNFKIVERFHEL